MLYIENYPMLCLVPLNKLLVRGYQKLYKIMKDKLVLKKGLKNVISAIAALLLEETHNEAICRKQYMFKYNYP